MVVPMHNLTNLHFSSIATGLLEPLQAAIFYQSLETNKKFGVYFRPGTTCPIAFGFLNLASLPLIFAHIPMALLLQQETTRSTFWGTVHKSPRQTLVNPSLSKKAFQTRRFSSSPNSGNQDRFLSSCRCNEHTNPTEPERMRICNSQYSWWNKESLRITIDNRHSLRCCKLIQEVQRQPPLEPSHSAIPSPTSQLVVAHCHCPHQSGRIPNHSNQTKAPHGSDIIITIHSVSKLPLRQKRKGKKKRNDKDNDSRIRNRLQSKAANTHLHIQSSHHAHALVRRLEEAGKSSMRRRRRRRRWQRSDGLAAAQGSSHSCDTATENWRRRKQRQRVKKGKPPWSEQTGAVRKEPCAATTAIHAPLSVFLIFRVRSRTPRTPPPKPSPLLSHTHPAPAPLPHRWTVFDLPGPSGDRYQQ